MVKLLCGPVRYSLLLRHLYFFDRSSYMTLSASLIGVTSLIFSAKGNPLGQLLMVIFSLLYGAISYTSRYYGEMITYLGMTLPMAVLALISWMKNPYSSDRLQVQVNQLNTKDCVNMWLPSIAVTAVFYWILRALHTSNLMLSTFSVTTSFLAVYLTYKRSAAYALAYAANDGVLILLWTLAAKSNPSYWSVVVCFIAFLANDLYGYASWRRMGKRQKNESCNKKQNDLQ